MFARNNCLLKKAEDCTSKQISRIDGSMLSCSQQLTASLEKATLFLTFEYCTDVLPHPESISVTIISDVRSLGRGVSGAASCVSGREAAQVSEKGRARSAALLMGRDDVHLRKSRRPRSR